MHDAYKNVQVSFLFLLVAVKNMGNAVSNVFGGRETKKRREQRLQTSVTAARSRLRNVQVDNRLALRGGVEQTKAVMVSMMDNQLMRSGKPFVKADLVGILLYFAVLKGEDPLTVVRTCSAKTNDELRSGKPFVKADLVGILLYFAVLKGEDPLTVVRTCSAKTNDELRFIIREAVYASESTLSALQHLGTEGMPVAAYAANETVEMGPGPVHEPAHGPVHEPAHGPVHEPAHGPVHEPAHGPVHGTVRPSAFSQYRGRAASSQPAIMNGTHTTKKWQAYGS